MENSLGVVEAEFVAFTGRATVERMMVVTYLLFLTSKGEEFHDEIRSLMEQAQIPEEELAWYWELDKAMCNWVDKSTTLGVLYDRYIDGMLDIVDPRNDRYSPYGVALVEENGLAISVEYKKCSEFEYQYFDNDGEQLFNMAEEVEKHNRYLIAIDPHAAFPKFVAGRFISERLENAKRK